jgi:type I restriction enzyme S subunit
MKVEEKPAVYAATQATVPTEWPIVPFEQVAMPQSDRGKRIKQRDYLPEGRIPVIDQGQTPVGGYTNDDDFAFLGELPVVLFGDHTRAVKLVDHRFAVGADGVKIFRPAAGVRPKYLYYWMKSARITDRGYGRHYQYLRQLSVPLPPPNKQDEIVAEIEKQFSRLDEAVANLKRVKANLKRYKAAVLKTAVEGRLVETEAERARRDGRSYETGAQLLQRILETRRSQWQGKGKYKEPVAPNTRYLPELPDGWVWATLEQLTTQIADVDHKMPKAFEGGIPYVSTKDFDGDNDISFAGAKRISPFDYDALCKKVRPELGDILLSRYGTVGEVRTVKTDMPFQVSYSVAILKPINSFETADFVATVLRSDVIQSQIKRDVRATAQPDLGLAHIRQFVVPFPSLDEQKQIIAEVERHLTLTVVAEAQVNSNLQRAERLRHTLLARAFTAEHIGAN